MADETFTTDRATDFTPQLRRIIASGGDALLLPNYAREDSIQVRQARALGFRGRFLSSDSWDPAGLYSIEEAIGTVVVGQ